MVDNLRDRALFDSERELKNTALILAEQIDRTFQAVDLVQISVIERIQSLGITSSDDYARRISSKDIHEMLKTSTSGLVQIYAISVINADGRLLNFSRFWPVPDISVADREFFLALKSDPKLTSFLLQRAELIAHLRAQPCVEIAERLVEQQDLRLEHQRTRDRDALLLAARQAPAPAARQISISTSAASPSTRSRISAFGRRRTRSG